MKILIGTPIHQVKNYSIPKWLKNVAQLQQEFPADLLLVDNSPDTEYMEIVNNYCQRFQLRNYKIVHLEFPHHSATINNDEEIHERITRCRERIRDEILSGGYEAWFSWECDQIIPSDALKKLVELLESGDFMVVAHNCWDRDNPTQVNLDYGVTLARRDCLAKYGFIPDFINDPNGPDSWYNAERWFRDRLRRDGCKYLEVCGVIQPIYHL